MRRFVRDRIAAALDRARPTLEEYVSERLSYPEGFPHVFPRPVVAIREVRKFKIAPLAKADLPPVKIDTLVKAWLTARESPVRDRWGPGVLDVDIELLGHGTAAPDGTYNVEPRSAVLKAWWRDMVVESKRVRPS
jgi:hypothetical protein